MMLCLRRTILFQQFNNDDDDNGDDDLLTDPLGGSSLLNYLQIKLHYINYNYKLHGGEKIWILCLSGKNNISRVSAANEWDIVLATRT